MLRTTTCAVPALLKPETAVVLMLVTFEIVVLLVTEATAPRRLIVQVLDACAKFRRLPTTYSSAGMLVVAKVMGWIFGTDQPP